jgi:hypothetical protein
MSPAPDEHDRIRAAMERIKIVKLKELRDKDATELAQLRADVDHLAPSTN